MVFACVVTCLREVFAWLPTGLNLVWENKARHNLRYPVLGLRWNRAAHVGDVLAVFAVVVHKHGALWRVALHELVRIGASDLWVAGRVVRRGLGWFGLHDGCCCGLTKAA